jgi:tripartite ATP-independent transporter DctP family solute receptor
MQSKLVGAARLAIGTLLLALAAAAPAQGVLKMGYFDKDREQFETGSKVFCDSVAQRTRGRYKCVRLGDALGSAPDLIEALRQGKLDALNVPVDSLEASVPELGLFDIPFLFRDAAHARRTLDGQVGLDLLKKLQDKGFVGLAWTESGMRHMSNNLRPIVAAADVKGLKMRTLDNKLQLAGYQALQIVPTSMPYPMLYDALEKGTLDGQENQIAVILDSKFARVQKHLSLTGHLYSPGLIMLSPALWAKLDSEDRQRFVDAAKKGASAQRRQASRESSAAVSVLKKNGMKVVERIDRESFSNALAPAYAEYEKAVGADTLAAVRAVK